MSPLEVRPFDPAADSDEWDEIVARAPSGTFLHSRRFLGYHCDRFVDRSLVLADEAGRPRAVFPAAEVPSRAGAIASHPGATYGGLIHDGSLRGETVIEALSAIADWYRRAGFEDLYYKPVPPIYHRTPASDDVYALFRLGARHWRVDLSATVDLGGSRKVTHGRRQQLKIAARHGVAVKEGWDWLEPFWCLLEENLRQRHGAEPVHSAGEMAKLADLFPTGIRLLTAHGPDGVLAGTVVFAVPPVLHVQYTATGTEGRRVGALDSVIAAAIDSAEAEGFRWFDYGISTVDDGRTLNSDLHAYKVSFGAGATLYDHYLLELR